jgi:hypothetical protein
MIFGRSILFSPWFRLLLISLADVPCKVVTSGTPIRPLSPLLQVSEPGQGLAVDHVKRLQPMEPFKNPHGVGAERPLARRGDVRVMHLDPVYGLILNPFRVPACDDDDVVACEREALRKIPGMYLHPARDVRRQERHQHADPHAPPPL